MLSLAIRMVRGVIRRAKAIHAIKQRPGNPRVVREALVEVQAANVDLDEAGALWLQQFGAGDPAEVQGMGDLSRQL